MFGDIPKEHDKILLPWCEINRNYEMRLVVSVRLTSRTFTAVPYKELFKEDGSHDTYIRGKGESLCYNADSVEKVPGQDGVWRLVEGQRFGTR